MTAEPVVVFDKASKWYGDVIGVNQVSLAIHQGIMGLLGPNGAGKSTLLKLLTGQLRAGSGTVRVFGQDPFKSPAVFRRVGYCPDVDTFYEEMTGRQFVSLMARLSNFGAADADLRARDRMELVSMGAHMDRAIRGYSKGMRQRTKLAAALVHDPELLVLDEPLNGLDIVGRREFLAMFKAFAAEGRTVIVSSHILHEVEALTRDVALLHHGRMLAEGRVTEIRELIENQPLTLQVTTNSARQLGSRLASLDAVHSVAYENTNTVVVRTNKPDQVYETLQTNVLDGHFEVSGLIALDDNLDAVFSYLVKE